MIDSLAAVGNHEYYSGTNLSRYLDATWQRWGPSLNGSGSGHNSGEGQQYATTATSAIGTFLSVGAHHGPGTHSKTLPSNTSRYFSLDFGLVHLVALSLNGYNDVDPCTDECNKAQLSWLRQDLAAVNRSKTPWVMAMSHFPMYLDVPGYCPPSRLPDGLDKCGLITDKGMQYLWNRTGCSTSWAELLKLDGGNGLRTYWSQQIDGGASDMMAYCNATLHKRATPQQLQFCGSVPSGKCTLQHLPAAVDTTHAQRRPEDGSDGEDYSEGTSQFSGEAWWTSEQCEYRLRLERGHLDENCLRVSVYSWFVV